MRAPDWLTAGRWPIAACMIGARHHRKHAGRRSGAIAGNFAIELDVQLTADGEAMVHHDDALGRLNEGGALLPRPPPS